VVVALAGCAVEAVEEPDQTVVVTEAPGQAVATAEELEWVVVAGGEDLTEHGSWACVGPVEVREGRLEVQAGSDWVTVLHGMGPRIEARREFGLRAVVRVEPEGRGQGAVVASGALPEGEWWQGVKRLEYGIGPGQVTITFWDGSQPQPAFSERHAVAGLEGEVELEFHRVGDTLTFYANEVEVAQMPDPGAFPEDQFYLGANVPPESRLIVEQIEVLAPRGREDEVRVVDPAQVAAPASGTRPLRELAAARGLYIGAAVGAGQLQCEPPYATVLAREFNMLTIENALKFGPVHPAPDRYDFSAADAIIAFAEANDMRVRGHTLVWHNQLPAWVEEGDWTRDELTKVLREHITTVVGRYRGRITAWDVVNEAIDDEGELRDTIWLRTIGPEYIDLAFRWAHEADPEALLFYNDYSCEALGCKSDAVYALVQDLLETGVPIHGVGWQMHVQMGLAPSLVDVRNNLRRLGALGVQVQITEMDVRVRNERPDTLERQAAVYADMLQVCLDAPSCTAFVMWGFTDRHSWIPAVFEGWDHALIFDEAYAPKPAYGALQEVLAR
jgi:endo-1,4-beta-xylanase